MFTMMASFLEELLWIAVVFAGLMLCTRPMQSPVSPSKPVIKQKRKRYYMSEIGVLTWLSELSAWLTERVCSCCGAWPRMANKQTTEHAVQGAPNCAVADEHPLLRAAITKLNLQDSAKLRDFLESGEAGRPGALFWGTKGMAGQLVFYDESTAKGISSATAINPSTAIRAAPPAPSAPSAPVTSEAYDEDACSEESDDKDNLATHLRELSQMDIDDRIIMVRKIQRLRFSSAVVLEAYFGKFGVIERMLVSHPSYKRAFGQQRIRPAAVGFVIMRTVADAQAALAMGKEQIVEGVPIEVHAFQKQSKD